MSVDEIPTEPFYSSDLPEEGVLIEGNQSDPYDVIVVGGGISGLTAGLYASRGGQKTLVLEGEFRSITDLPGGQLVLTPEIENYPGFVSGSGNDLVQIVRGQAESFGAVIKTEAAVAYEFSSDASDDHVVLTGEGNRYRGRTVILATGAIARRLGVVGEDEFFGRGVSVCATCDGAFFQDKTVAVVGGGDSAVEDALFLTAYAKKVYLIHRRDRLRTTSPQARALLTHPNVEVVWNSQVDHIRGDGNEVKAVVLDSGNALNVDGVFIAIGHDPAVDHLSKTPVVLNDGNYIAVSHPSSLTNIPGVFAAGDVVDDVYRQAITAAGSGCKAALDAHRWLLER